MENWFAVDNTVVDRDDLTIQEKMACVVLARYAGKAEFNHLLSLDIIAVKMGVSSPEAQAALEGLMEKGLLMVEEGTQAADLFAEDAPDQLARIVRPQVTAPEPPAWDAFEDEDHIVPHVEPEDEPEYALDLSVLDEEDEELDFDSLKEELLGAPADPLSSKRDLFAIDKPKEKALEEAEPPSQPRPKKKVNVEALVDELREIIEERINDREARIILGMAGNDLNRVRVCYSRAKNTQVADPIDMLIHELQKPAESQPPKRRHSVDPVQAESRTVVERIAKNVRDEQPLGGQLNTMRIHQMKKYQQFNKKK